MTAEEREGLLLFLEGTEKALSLLPAHSEWREDLSDLRLSFSSLLGVSWLRPVPSLSRPVLAAVRG